MIDLLTVRRAPRRAEGNRDEWRIDVEAARRIGAAVHTYGDRIPGLAAAAAVVGRRRGDTARAAAAAAAGKDEEGLGQTEQNELAHLSLAAVSEDRRRRHSGGAGTERRRVRSTASCVRRRARPARASGSPGDGGRPADPGSAESSPRSGTGRSKSPASAAGSASPDRSS